MLFKDERFGMFIHYGIYAVGGWQEQEWWRRRMTKEDYVRYAEHFSPRHGCVDEWLDLAAASGVEYVCFTAKHHDGFCMFDTAYTDFKITNTPYGKDMLAEVAEGCRKRGLAFAIYYSLPDWHQKNAVKDGGDHQLPAQNAGDEPNDALYKEYLKNQITELLTHYGKVDALFWDIPAKEKDPSVNELVRRLQPHILINDRGYSEGDYATPERTVPPGAFTRLTEACQSVGMQSWGYRAEEDYFTTAFLQDSVDRIMTKGGNYILNVGPMADGSLPEEAKARLSGVGKWYLSVKESFLHAETVVCQKIPHGMTRKGNCLYIHLPTGYAGSGLSLSPIDVFPVSATLLNTGEAVDAALRYVPFFFDPKSDECKHYLHLRGLPAETLHEPMVIRLTFKEADMPALLRALGGDENGNIVL